MCFNCKGAHQANSTKCPLFVEAQKRRDKRRGNPRNATERRHPERGPSEVVEPAAPTTKVATQRANEPGTSSAGTSSAGTSNAGTNKAGTSTNCEGLSMEQSATDCEDAQNSPKQKRKRLRKKHKKTPLQNSNEVTDNNIDARQSLQQMQDEANGIKNKKTYAAALINTNEQIAEAIPIVSVETMVQPNPVPSVNPPQAIAREGGSGLITMVTTLIKTMCPSPVVHSIVDAFVVAVDSYYRNPGPTALLEAINVFNGHFKST